MKNFQFVPWIEKWEQKKENSQGEWRRTEGAWPGKERYRTVRTGDFRQTECLLMDCPTRIGVGGFSKVECASIPSSISAMWSWYSPSLLNPGEPGLLLMSRIQKCMKPGLFLAFGLLIVVMLPPGNQLPHKPCAEARCMCSSCSPELKADGQHPFLAYPCWTWDNLTHCHQTSDYTNEKSINGTIQLCLANPKDLGKQ